mgnify:CR=1 FL=1
MPSIIDLKFRNRPKVALAIPSTEFLPRQAFWAFMFMAQTLKPGDHLLQTETVAVPAVARNTLIKGFMDQTDAEYLLLFDADMVPPANIIDTLVSYRVPFVSAYCTRKQYPYLPIPALYSHTSIIGGETVHEYKPVTDMQPDSGLQVCDGTGAAALCIRRDVIEAIEPPWFRHEGGGEDYYFCRKVQAVKTADAPDGVPILIDTHSPVGHIGTEIAYPSTWFSVKEQYMAETGETEVGYAIARQFWGRGFAAEAAEAFLDYGFQRLDLDKIVAVAHPENTGSRRVMEKLGMRFDYTGKFYDNNLVHYSITKNQFKQDGQDRQDETKSYPVHPV